MDALIQIIRPMDPIIFHLSSDNVCERLIKARSNRGQTSPDNGQIEFWEKRKKLLLGFNEMLFTFMVLFGFFLES
ncbi:hypothetical protein [Lachnoclostridium sp.]|uniref:hypothetical protein n=1 Tax=Lachnoclostridium sp. TaxID=2028282 RepID=UPI002899D239|nr:hypothetical protein [Lachnoclostridium sp.]